MEELVKEFQARLNKFVVEKERLCFMTRAIELQRAACLESSELFAEASKLKHSARDSRNENAANALLAFEEVLKTLVSELKMWIALKEDAPFEAWNYLIDAQGAASHAARAHPVGQHMEQYAERLEAIEKLVFPSQVFNSPGMVIRSAVCSICDSEYGECEHIKGKAYMGEFCGRIIKDVTFTEVSFVDDPADKRCIVTSFSPDGKRWIDRMTFRELPSEDHVEIHKETDQDGQEKSQDG